MLKDYFYIKAFLLKIELTKQLFTLEIQQGTEVLIPRQFSQEDIPWSFRYYDPIMSIVDGMLSPDSKQFFNLRTEYNKNE